MKTLSKIFFTGLATILPLLATVYILYWLAGKAESVFGGILILVLPQGYYSPGYGLVAGFLLVLALGLMMRAILFRRLVHAGEEWLAKLPLVKTLYGSIRDLMQFVSGSKGKSLGQVVLISMSDEKISAIGFLTNNNVRTLAGDLPEDSVAVYLPLSYQIGGHTVIVPRAMVRPINMSVNEAMRFAITAGMAVRGKEGGAKAGE